MSIINNPISVSCEFHKIHETLITEIVIYDASIPKLPSLSSSAITKLVKYNI